MFANAYQRALRIDSRSIPMTERAWNWLGWAYTGLEALAYTLDLLEGTEAEQIEVYRHIGREPA